MDFFFQNLSTYENIAQDIVLFGGAAMALYYGIKRVYRLARNVEKLVEDSDKNKEANDLHRNQIKEDLMRHEKVEDERHAIRDQKIDSVTTDLSKISEALHAHIKTEEERDLMRDQQLVKISDHMSEVIAEMRPNGGSSMKDIVNSTSKAVSDIRTRVAVLEEWKGSKGNKKVPRKVIRKKKRKD